ncbi:MAG TPA: hypothetical protein VN706_12560 [Gemmatimonadaceae bacterium]|nr:hypothetical protein [Gemmatimonadaceae bacterium]
MHLDRFDCALIDMTGEGVTGWPDNALSGVRGRLSLLAAYRRIPPPALTEWEYQIRGVDVDAPGFERTVLAQWEWAQAVAIESRLRAIWLYKTSPRLAVAMECAVRLSYDKTRVTELALAAGVPARTLEWWLRADGMPTARHVLGWSRVLRATWLLERGGLALKHVAPILGFPSPLGLGAMITRYVGQSVRRSVKHGAYSVAVDRLKTTWPTLFPPKATSTTNSGQFSAAR